MGDSNNIQENNSKKKKIIFMIIGLVILLILVIGSTYAYFSVDVDTSQSRPTNITATTGKIGNATLTGLNSKLYLNVSASDMSEANAGKTYWATPNEEDGRIESETDVYQKIAEVSISGGEEDTNYMCSADVVVAAEGTMNGAVYSSGYNELLFNLSSTTLNSTTDFYWDKLSSKTIKWNFKIKGNSKAELQAYLKLVNGNQKQNYLSGTNLKIDIETQNLTCEVYEPFTGGNGAELAKSSQLGLNNELVGDMYRFQGNGADNHLCFGQKCDNESEDMYQIIGITIEGNIKVIKQMSIGYMDWHNDAQGDTKWPNSDLYKYLNTDMNGFYSTLDAKIKDKIEEHIWKYGDIQDEEGDTETYGNANTTGEGVYNIEKEWQDTTQANIGLMYLSDYYLASSNTANCKDFENKGFLECANSWIHQKQNGVGVYTAYEWTMSRYGGDIYYDNVSDAWSVDSNGGVYWGYQSNRSGVRPVFYLTPETTISSGIGTAEDPFVIE